MTTRGVKSPYWRGLIDGLPFLAVVGPFGLLFGVISAEAGLSVLDAVAFSVAVIAGAAQFTALHLMTDHAPTIVVLVSALAVNLRMAMYSASLAPHLGPVKGWVRAIASFFVVDQVYGLSMRRWSVIPHEPLPRKLAFYFGAALPMSSAWVGSSALGLVPVSGAQQDEETR